MTKTEAIVLSEFVLNFEHFYFYIVLDFGFRYSNFNNYYNALSAF